MTVLYLKDHGVMRARYRVRELAGKSAFARGEFSAVFEGTAPDRVLKLTLDPASHDYLVDGHSPQSIHKPIVHNDFGDIGETSTGETIFLTEIERLKPMPSKCENRLLMRRLMRGYRKSEYREVPNNHKSVPGYPISLACFMEDLNTFASNFKYRIDGKVGQNYMERISDGTLVASDPVFDAQLYKQYRKPAYL